MATRLKGSKPFLVWLCFFIGLSIVLVPAEYGITQARNINDNIGDIMAAVRSNVKGMSAFKKDMADRFCRLIRVVEDGSHYNEFYISDFAYEGKNLSYYAKNVITGQTVGNIDPSAVIKDNSVTLPPGCDYYLYFDGVKFTARKDGKTIDIFGNNSGYLETSLNQFNPGGMSRYENLRILLIVRKDIAVNPAASSHLYQIRNDAEAIRWTYIGFGAVLLGGLMLLLFAFYNRRSKREVDRKLAGWSGFLWLEPKAALSVLASLYVYRSSFGLGDYFYYYDNWDRSFRIDTFGFSSRALTYLAIAACFWWFYIMAADLIVNKKRFFTHNSMNWLINKYRASETGKPLQQVIIGRLYALVLAEAFLTAIAAAIFKNFANGAPYAAIFVLVGVYLLFRYFRRFAKTVRDIGILTDRIEALKDGEISSAKALAADSDFYFAEQGLDSIKQSINRLVEEKVKSERTKVELVTNVSHDLKTPLTSIISYTDLLAKEEGLPDHAKDYIGILSQKSDRLKTLIQDLFDLSKATTGAMELEMEQIDLGKLIRQTMADMDEQIGKSGLAFRMNFPDEPVMITSDGKKLYRVFQNLFSNILKYALADSRVYLELRLTDKGGAAVEIKNIANYEMDFKTDEILERFVRGDKTRSTEGSGLGLAIAKSFTELCGGSFDIGTDGDLFKVCLGFDLAPSEVPAVNE